MLSIVLDGAQHAGREPGPRTSHLLPRRATAVGFVPHDEPDMPALHLLAAAAELAASQ
jgi:hypothetical protein